MDPPPVPLPQAADADEITERALEEHLERHWDETPFAENGSSWRGASGTLARAPGVHSSQRDRPTRLPGEGEAGWVIELKRNRSPDTIVGQVSRYLGWIAEERRGRRESAVGAIVIRHADASCGTR